MKSAFRTACVFALLLPTLAAAAVASPVASAAAPVAAPDPARPADCPPSKLYPPRYPIDMMRSGRSGIAKVRARIDGCGRVLSVELAESSGHGQLNDAALEAVAGFVLPAAMAARAVDGVVVLPMKFGEVSTVDLKPIDWPASHRRPRYLVDEEPVGHASIAAFRDAGTLRDGPSLEPPYGATRLRDGGMVTTWMQRDKADPAIWWLQYNTQGPLPKRATAPLAGVRTDAVVRYRLGADAGGPVVRVAMLCERPAEECATLQAFLLKGLPFAKAR